MWPSLSSRRRWRCYTVLSSRGSGAGCLQLFNNIIERGKKRWMQHHLGKTSQSFNLCIFVSTSWFVMSRRPDSRKRQSAVMHHTWYLSFFLHGQNFWRIKFTPKKRVNYDKIHSKLPFFCVITAKYTVNCQFFALNL